MPFATSHSRAQTLDVLRPQFLYDAPTRIPEKAFISTLVLFVPGTVLGMCGQSAEELHCLVGERRPRFIDYFFLGAFVLAIGRGEIVSGGLVDRCFQFS
ncbi:MAG: hypothetical protein R6U98_21545 [Pirellulaceae bacterium]